jgi:acetylcholinesterase
VCLLPLTETDRYAGGGFFDGGAPDLRYNLSFIVQNSVNIGKPIIAASIAYRLGPFGFLNGNDVASAGVANLGLKDQRLALHWIQENIAGFGGMQMAGTMNHQLTETGDPSKVTIWGESAGALSVGFHLVAFNGRDDKLFRAGIMESGNPVYSSATNGSDWYQPRYARLVEAAGCSNSTDSLDCLRRLPLFVLNNVLNKTEFNSGWGPAFDGDFIARLGSEQLADGSFIHVPVISGANTDEGTAFSPLGINKTADFVYYLNSESSNPTSGNTIAERTQPPHLLKMNGRRTLCSRYWKPIHLTQIKEYRVLKPWAAMSYLALHTVPSFDAALPTLATKCSLQDED